MGGVKKSMDRKTNVSTETVLDATRKMLSKYGSAVSLELVAAEAGLTRQTLYNRFGSKQTLLRAAFDDLRQQIHTRLDDAPWNSTPEILLPVIARIVADSFLDLAMAKLLRAMIQAVEDIPEIGTSLRSDRTGQVLQKLTEYLQAKTEAGEFHVADAETQAMLFLGSISGFLFPRLLLGTVTPDEEVNQRLIDTSIASFLRMWRSAE